MHPNNICSCVSDRERFIQSIGDISVGDTVQQEYWAKGTGAYKNRTVKYAKVLAVGNEKIFVQHNDGSECAWTFHKRRWVYYVPKQTLCLNTKNKTTEFISECEELPLHIIRLKTESGQYIVKEEN
jgi:hypothetical protein